MAAKSKNTTGQSVREGRTKDPSPNWNDVDKLTGEEFTLRYRAAMDWYRLEKSNKDLKPKVIDWMAKNNYSKEDIALFKRTKDSRCSVVTGSLAACLLKGMPEQHPEFNKGRNIVEYLRANIAKILEEGINDKESEDDVEEKSDTYVPNIQDRLKEAASAMCEDLDYAIDSFIEDPDSFDPKAIKITNLLRGKQAKAAHARIIKSHFSKNIEDYKELLSKDCDPQLLEGYSHYGKKNIKKMYDFLSSISEACDQIIGEAKLNKKPRTKKVKPVEELVKKIKFKASDDRYKITSIPPAQIVGANIVVVFNTKNRKLGVYISKDSNGLNVKGASIINFTEKSEQKTLRKPDIQLKEFKELNTGLRAQKWFGGIKTTSTMLNGRINSEVMILKAWK